MNKKALFIVILYFFLQSCGYGPIYTEDKNVNLKIDIKNISGDNDINNLVSTQIRKYSNLAAKKSISLNIKSEYTKNVLSKNKEGKITNYLIKSRVEFIIVNSEVGETYVFEEETKAASMDNQFEFKKYENTIKSNFINSAIEQFIMKISSIQ
tara:strand:+ start:696 stop:1154 length:459 start_codon:yes stop_codon:yes gene_type:complete